LSWPDGHLLAKRSTEDPDLAKFHGLARSLVANAVGRGDRRLQARARHRRRGYRAEVKGPAGQSYALGYFAPVVLDIPTGIEITIDKQTHITVMGVDRQLVGAVVGEHSAVCGSRIRQAEGRPLYR
jgi:large subunit ribosomal protein L6